MRCLAATSRKADAYYEPDVSVRLDGYLTNDLSYRVYARSQYEAFVRRRTEMPRLRAWVGA